MHAGCKAKGCYLISYGISGGQRTAGRGFGANRMTLFASVLFMREHWWQCCKVEQRTLGTPAAGIFYADTQGDNCSSTCLGTQTVTHTEEACSNT